MTIRDVQNRLRGGQDVDTVLLSARETLSANSFRELLEWIWGASIYWRKSFHPPYPKLEELHLLSLFGNIGVAKEVRWAAAYLIPHAARLQDFIGRKTLFERAFLSGEFDQCAHLLASVESDFGCSLSLIRLRVILLQARSGLDAQKQYAEAISEQLPDSIPAFVAYNTGVLNEPTVTLSRYFPWFHRQMMGLDLQGDLRNYLRYLIHPISHVPVSAIGDILRFANAGAIVDYYTTFIRMVHQISALNDETLVSAARRAAREVGDYIQYPQLVTFRTVLDGVIRSGLLPPSTSVAASNSLLGQDVVSASRAAEAILLQNPSDPDALIVAARSRTSASSKGQGDPGGPPWRTLVWRLREILDGEAGQAEHVNEVQRLALNFFGSGWSHVVRGLIEDEESSTVEPERGGFMHLAAVGGDSVHPLRGAWLPPGPERAHFAAAASDLIPESVSTRYLCYLAGKGSPQLDGVGSDERALVEARVALASRNSDEALAKASSILESDHSFFRKRAARIASQALLDLGRVGDAADMIADLYLRRRIPDNMLPLRGAATAIIAMPSVAIRSSLSTSILLDLYSQHVDRELNTYRVFAYQDFLESHRMSRPSELREIQDRFPKEDLVYFLRYVCVESVMDCSIVFQSSREVVEERLAVCRLLTELAEHDASAYLDEIKILVRRLMVQSRMKEIEQSKIYVDVESIRRTVDEDLREMYGRYRALRRARAERHEIDEDALLILQRVLQSTFGDRVVLNVPRRETAELLEGIITRVREEYVSSPEHGLDKYLSVRVRHGTLTAHLRRPLEARHLITPREVGSPRYKLNEYWEDRLQTEEPGNREAILERLGRFSADFDQLVEEIRTWAQVKKDGEGPGMFDFTTTVLQFSAVSQFITEDMSFEQALDAILAFLGSVLDDHLESIRERLDNEGKNRASELLDRLGADVGGMSEGFDVRELVNEIRSANIELRVEFDRVGNWFRRSQITANAPFPLADAIDISTESVRVMSDEFNVETRFQGDEPPVCVGALLATFVDMFLIMFENVVRHAGTAVPGARVEVSVSRESGSKGVTRI